jgi:Protein of unknown function (DUF2510)
MVRSLRATGAFVGGLLGVVVLVAIGTGIVLAILGAPANSGQAVGKALALPQLIGGSLLGWWLAKGSLAKTAAPAATPVPFESTGTATAGWYTDPQGQLRWWDGRAWTQHVAANNSGPQPG